MLKKFNVFFSIVTFVMMASSSICFAIYNVVEAAVSVILLPIALIGFYFICVKNDSKFNLGNFIVFGTIVASMIIGMAGVIKSLNPAVEEAPWILQNLTIGAYIGLFTAVPYLGILITWLIHTVKGRKLPKSDEAE